MLLFLKNVLDKVFAYPLKMNKVVTHIVQLNVKKAKWHAQVGQKMNMDVHKDRICAFQKETENVLSFVRSAV